MAMSEKNSVVSEKIQSILKGATSLQLATLSLQNHPFSSYSPYALGEHCLYLLVSELSPHTHHLHNQPIGCVMILDKMSESSDPYVCPRVQYDVSAEFIDEEAEEYQIGIDKLVKRFGKSVTTLSAKKDFYLVRLNPQKVNFIQEFGNDLVIEESVLY